MKKCTDYYKRLGNKKKMSTRLIMGSKGVLAQTLVKEWKEINCKDMEEDEDTDKGEEDEENIETDPNKEENTRNNDSSSEEEDEDTDKGEEDE